MSPFEFFIATLCIAAFAAIAQFIVRTLEKRRLATLAAAAGMNYAPDDRFHLLDRILKFPPAPGAADISLRDLIYKNTTDGHVFLATVDYTTGAIRAKKRHRRISLVREATTGVAIIHGAPDAPQFAEFRRLVDELK